MQGTKAEPGIIPRAVEVRITFHVLRIEILIATAHAGAL